MRLSHFLTALATLAAATNATPNQNTSRLAVELKLISNTEIKALITNTGKHDLRLLNTDTILSKASVEKVHVTYNNTRVPFVGARVSVVEKYLNESAFEALKAGKTVESIFDLARMFDLSRGGEYTVQANASIPIANANGKITTSVTYVSNVLQVRIDGIRAARSRRQAYSMAKRAKAQACTGTRQLVVQKALEHCRLLASAGEYYADQGPADRMDEYFKQSDRQTRDTVTNVFRDVGKLCANMTDGPPGVSCDDIHNECTPNTMAITYAQQGQIVLCDLFFYFTPTASVACGGIDRGAVLVHEMTHLPDVKGTIGNDYDYDSLANKSADTNLNLADAYAFFAHSATGEACTVNRTSTNGFSLYTCRYKSGGGCIYVHGKTNVPPDFDHKIDIVGAINNFECLAFDKANCEGEKLKINKVPWRGHYELPNDWVERISSFRCPV